MCSMSHYRRRVIKVQARKSTGGKAVRRNVKPPVLRAIDVEDEEDDEYEDPAPQPSTSRRSLTFSEKNADSITALVRALIFRDQSKEPFKKCDIFRLAFPHTTHKKDDANMLWKEAESKLKETFGLLLQPLDDSHYGMMILIKEKRSPIIASNASLNPSIHDGLLVVVLGVIFMSGGSLEENGLLDVLNKLDIDLNSQVLLPGNKKVAFKDLLNSIWKKQLYIETNEIRNHKKTFHWGPRAEIEICKQEILGLMARIMKSRPEQWREQYREAYGRDPGRFIETDNGRVSVRTSTASNNASQPRSSTISQPRTSTVVHEVLVLDDDDDDDNNNTVDDDDDDIQLVYHSQSRTSQSQSQSRRPLKPKNAIVSNRSRRSRR